MAKKKEIITDSTDSDERFSLLELDDKPIVRVCLYRGCDNPAVANELCEDHQRGAKKKTERKTEKKEEPKPVETVIAYGMELPASGPSVYDAQPEQIVPTLQSIADAPRPPEGMVHGFILPEDVNPTAGYFLPVIAKKGEPTRYADDRLHAAAMVSADAARAKRIELGFRPAPVRQQRALSNDLPAAFREGLLAARDRTNGTKKKAEKETEILVPALKFGELLAGAVAEGSGAITCFGGQNELSLNAIDAAIAEAGLPAELQPSRKSAHIQAAHAVEALNNRGMVARSAQRKGGSPKNRGWRARWTIGPVNHAGEVGDELGKIALTAVLELDNTLTVRFAGDEIEVGSEGDLDQSQRDMLTTRRLMAKRVTDEYARRRADEMFKSVEVSNWLRNTLIWKYGCVTLSKTFYVPSPSREPVARLLTAMAKRWGTDWMLPMIPIVTNDELRDSIAASFLADVAKVMERFDTAQAAKQAKTGTTELGEGKAGTLYGDLLKVSKMTQVYELLLGSAVIVPLRAKLKAALDKVEEFVSDTEARGSLIWDEIMEEAETEEDVS